MTTIPYQQNRLSSLPPPSPVYSNTMPILDNKTSNRLYNEINTPTISSSSSSAKQNNNLNSQSMTTEETRRLTGVVAKTRALFESKESLSGSNTQLNQQQSLSSIKPLSQISRSKQNLSNYNLNELNNQTLQQKFQPTTTETSGGPKQSFSATNLSSILQKSINKSNNDLNNKENQQQPLTPTTPTTPTTPGSFILPKTQYQNPLLRNYKTTTSIEKSSTPPASQNKQTIDQSYLTSIFVKPTLLIENKESPSVKSNFEMVDDDKISNLSDNPLKSETRKLRKFNFIDNNNENTKEITDTKKKINQYLINTHSQTGIVLPATSVQKAKLNFENLATTNKFKLQSNATHLPPQPTIDKNSFNNANLNQDDNTSVSSVSSLSSTSTSLTASSSSSNNQKNDSNPNLHNSKFEALKIAAGSSLSSSTSSTSSSSASPIVNENHQTLTTTTTTTQPTSTRNVKLELTRTLLNKTPSSYSTSASSSLPSSCDTTPRNNDTSKPNRIFKLENTLAQLNKETTPSIVDTKNTPVILRNLKPVSSENRQHKAESHYLNSINEQPKLNDTTKTSSGYVHPPHLSSLQKQIDTSEIISEPRNRLSSVEENISEEKVNFRSKLGSSYQTHVKNCLSVPTPSTATAYQNYVQNKQKMFENNISNLPPPSSSSKANRNRSVSLINQTEVQQSKKETTPVKRVIRSASSAREALLRWCRKMTEDYNNIRIDNFSSSWANGLAFCALIHHFLPNEYNYDSLDATNRRYNFELAFKTAEDKAGIVALLDVEDMIIMGDSPDWKCVFTYVHSIYQRFKEESLKN